MKKLFRGVHWHAVHRWKAMTLRISTSIVGKWVTRANFEKIGFKGGYPLFFSDPIWKRYFQSANQKYVKTKVLEYYNLALETKFCDIWTKTVQVMAVLRFREN